MMLWHARVSCSTRRILVLDASSTLVASHWASVLPRFCLGTSGFKTRQGGRSGCHARVMTQTYTIRGLATHDDDDGQTLKGSIHVIIGPMFSGKTSRLLRETAELERQGVTDILLLKSDKDSRYSSDHIVSHDGVLKKCFAVRELLRDVMESDQLKESYTSSRVVAIDEAQFFDRDLIEFCTRAADKDKKHVILAGLDGDFTRSRFGYMLDMIPLADTVTKLTGRCHFCDEDALFSRRIGSDNEQQEEIGGAEKYVPVCREHYLMRET